MWAAMGYRVLAFSLGILAIVVFFGGMRFIGLYAWIASVALLLIAYAFAHRADWLER